MQYDKITDNIRNKLRNYITTNKIESLVIGISGGIDSALCAALAKPICDELKIPLIGRSLPASTNKNEEVVRANNIGVLFCNDFEEYNISSYCEKLLPLAIGAADDVKGMKIRQGNIMARIRMIILYNLALKHKGLVLSTDNYTEYLLGFWTLHGDVGDYGMMQNLWKTEVYELAEYLINDSSTELTRLQRESLQSCVDAVPTDGLGITNSDLDQLGAPTYKEVDEILQRYLKAKKKMKYDPEIKVHPVLQRYERTHYKRNNPANISREELLE